MKRFGLILLIVLTLFMKIQCQTNSNTLKLLHIVFRHGDRYLSDVPYSENTNFSYYDIPLTEKGKANSYLLGQWLQDRYGEFLGPYSSDLVKTANTYFKRTRSSLLLVLQGLFSSKDLPVEKNLEVDKNEFTLSDLPLNNSLFVLLNPTCKNYFNFYNTNTKSVNYQNTLKKYTDLNEYIKTYSNKSLRTLIDFMDFYDTLSVQQANNLSLPLWTKPLMPILKSVVVDYFITATSTSELRQIVIGGFIKNVVETSTLKFNNQLEPKNRKLFIYSGHDLNVYCTLNLFKRMLKIRPPYNSCLMIESHTIDGIDGFKVFYKNSPDDEVKTIVIPDCGLFCPLSKFTQLYQEYFSTFDTC